VEVKWCEHWSEYVWLACQRELDEAEVFGTLRPVRGMGLIELGFQEVRFPEYYVKKAEAAMNTPYKEGNPPGTHREIRIDAGQGSVICSVAILV